MSIMEIVLGTVLVVLSARIIIGTLFVKKDASALGGIIAGSNPLADEKRKESPDEKLNKVIGILALIAALVIIGMGTYIAHFAG